MSRMGIRWSYRCFMPCRPGSLGPSANIQVSKEFFDLVWFEREHRSAVAEQAHYSCFSAAGSMS